jgi:hypothetical protein
MFKKTLVPPFFSFLVLLVAVASFTACKEDPDNAVDTETATLEFKTVLDLDQLGSEIKVGDTITMSSNRDFNVKKFKLYLSNICLKNEAGEEKEIYDILLADVGDPVTGGFTVNIPAGTYTGIKLGLGLDSLQNDQNPEDFPREHPLSSWNQMYWSMLKYRFVILEGRSGDSGTLGSQTDILHAYHPGTDPLYEIVDLPLNFSVAEGESSTVALHVSLEGIFNKHQKIDLVTEPQTHSEPVDIHIAKMFMENLALSVNVRAE